MSRVRSDKFTNRAATGPCSFTHGIHAIEATGVGIGVSLGYGGLVAVGATISGDITASSTIKVGTAVTINSDGNVDVIGIITASSYYGDASNMDNAGISAGKAMGLAAFLG